jgi:hypothetical protein
MDQDIDLFASHRWDIERLDTAIATLAELEEIARRCSLDALADEIRRDLRVARLIRDALPVCCD